MQHIVKGMGVTKCKSNIFETDIFCTLSFNSSINTIAYLIHQKEKKNRERVRDSIGPNTWTLTPCKPAIRNGKIGPKTPWGSSVKFWNHRAPPQSNPGWLSRHIRRILVIHKRKHGICTERKARNHKYEGQPIALLSFLKRDICSIWLLPDRGGGNRGGNLEKDWEIFLILCICRTCKGKSVNLIASVDEAMIIHHGRPVRSWYESSNQIIESTGRIPLTTPSSVSVETGSANSSKLIDSDAVRVDKDRQEGKLKEASELRDDIAFEGCEVRGLGLGLGLEFVRRRESVEIGRERRRVESKRLRVAITTSAWRPGTENRSLYSLWP